LRLEIRLPRCSRWLDREDLVLAAVGEPARLVDHRIVPARFTLRP